MWIVRLALRRPYNIHRNVDAILILGVLSIFVPRSTSFPVVDIPVIAII